MVNGNFIMPPTEQERDDLFLLLKLPAGLKTALAVV